MAPLISHVYELGFMDAVAIQQTECFQGSILQLCFSSAKNFSTRKMNETRITLVTVLLDELGTAALQFARTEGIIPAPEPAHAIAAAIREALECKKTGEEKVILMAMCGHGHFDLASYEKYMRGDMVDLSHPAEKLEASLAAVPKI